MVIFMVTRFSSKITHFTNIHIISSSIYQIRIFTSSPKHGCGVRVHHLTYAIAIIILSVCPSITLVIHA